MHKFYIISRIHTPFFSGIKKGKFFHTGSPAYFNFIKYMDLQNDKFDYEIIFIENRENAGIFLNKEYTLENLKKQINIIHYKKIFKKNKRLIKLEIILNKLFQYISIFIKVKANSIYYLDRENIPFGILLSFKGGLICYRLLGITKNIYNILFYRNDLVSKVYKKALNIKNSIIISSNDGSWAEKTKSNLKDSNFHLLFNGVDYELKLKLFNKKNTYILTYISRLEKGKGHFEFIEIINNILKKGFTSIKVNIIGEGKLKNELIKFCKEENILEYFNFTGVVEHSLIEDYLEKTDIFISINYFGIFGNNILEATSKSMPIIVLDNEYVSNYYKKYFYLMSNNNFSKTSEFIIQLLSDEELFNKYCQMSQAFFSKFICSWEKRINNEMELINNEFQKR